MSDLAESRTLQPLPGHFATAPVTSVTGLWECDLATEQLIWSDGVYDLFDLPRTTALNRAMTADRYVPESRIAMECRRVAAIRDKTGFTVDAQIRVGSGTRWIRIVAHVACVEGVAVRLFGSKSDVSHEYAVWGAAARTGAALS